MLKDDLFQLCRCVDNFFFSYCKLSVPQQKMPSKDITVFDGIEEKEVCCFSVLKYHSSNCIATCSA